MIERLKTALCDKSATIGIVGLGYVGLPLMLRFSESGYPVIGFDVDSKKVKLLQASESFIEHIPSSSIRLAVDKGAKFTDDFKSASVCDCLIICVPTPLNKNREPDLGYVVQTIQSLQPYMRSGQLLSLESTTYPGTTEEIIALRISNMGFNIGEDYFVVYSPEREDPGNQVFSTQSIPKIVGGCTTECLNLGVQMYAGVIDDIVPVSSPSVAEMTKLLENIHRAVNIGLVNEMKVVADKMGIDIFEVIDAAKTKPFGFTAYYPGPGLGGHCIPIDPFYLTWKAREFGLNTRFIELSGEVNRAMPQYVVAKLIDGLNEIGKALKGSSILVLGIAYKKNVDDHRESPAFEIMDLISQKGGAVAYSDPHVPVFPPKRQYHYELSSTELNEESVRSFDAVVLVTDHDLFDYEMIRRAARLLVDSRGRYREPEDKIIRA